jgi:Copper amine oxidase N-terminal domain.
MADSAGLELSLRCPDGVKFAARPMAAVVEGDIVLNSNGYVYLRDRGNDGTYEEAYIKIEKAGTVLSAIRFANIILDVYSDCPDGPIELSVGGSSLVEEECVEVFGDNVAARAVIGQIYTAAPVISKSNGIFWVGKSYYNQNESMAMAGVAPYIKDGRVYLPLRNIAYLYGLTDRGITWDQATQAVTLNGGGNLVVMNIGRNEYKLNGADMRMEVPPEIYNGHTMVPARYLVEALGGKITWNDQLKAIYLQFK